MGAPEGFVEAYRGLKDEHREVLGLAMQIKTAPTVSLVDPLVRRLHGFLVSHFEHEQHPGGFYEKMGAYAPRFHETVRYLVRDHEKILSELRGIIEQLEGISNRGAPPPESCVKVVEHLEDHERREHELALELMK